MGKRTKQVTGKTHKPRPRDYWKTIDPRAIPPLLPHLPKGVRYAEPMAGDGSLIRLIGDHAACVYAADLEPQADGIIQADAVTTPLPAGAEVVISNPPWLRALLHQMIVALSDQRPTWFLFDSDWANTAQAGRFKERLRRVVYVGRLVWIEGTTNGGFTACSWYLFDKPREGNVPQFFPSGCLPPGPRRAVRVCADCGQVIDRFGKWTLQPRNGVAAPVHRHCDNPTGRVALGAQPLLPAPLFECKAIDLPRMSARSAMESA